MNLIPFDLEAAKAGAKIITKVGQNVRIGIWNAKGKYPLIGAVTYRNSPDEFGCSWTLEGYSGYDNELNLYMAPEKLYIGVWDFHRISLLHSSLEKLRSFINSSEDASAEIFQLVPLDSKE